MAVLALPLLLLQKGLKQYYLLHIFSSFLTVSRICHHMYSTYYPTAL